MIEVAGGLRDRNELPSACAAVRDLIHAQAEGVELSPQDAEALEVHLAGCADCAAERRRVKSFTTNMSDLLRSLRPAVDLRKRVLAKIEITQERSHLWTALAALGGAVAFALLVLALSHRAPVAKIVAASGSPVVLREVDLERREAPSARELMNGDQLRLEAGETARVAGEAFEFTFEGPALAELQRDPSGGSRIHILERTTLRGDVSASSRLELHAGTIAVRASDARLEMAVDGAGCCRIWVISGRLDVSCPSGIRALQAVSSLRIDQHGNVVEP